MARSAIRRSVSGRAACGPSTASRTGVEAGHGGAPVAQLRGDGDGRQQTGVENQQFRSRLPAKVPIFFLEGCV